MKVFLASVLLLSITAGCLSSNGSRDDDVAPDYPACVHPYPCGNEWPAGLAGPFAYDGPTSVEVASHDGVMLRGWLFTPTLPDGLGAPTIITSTPYVGLNTNPPGAQEGGFGLLARWVEAGYAVLAMSVRGTGVSDGCFENKGATEQADQAFLVEWAAAQPWSNGRVAMAGTSYPGTTPFMAAIQQPPHLVAIMTNGPVTDPYTELHTPQGASYTMGGAYEAGRRAIVTFAQANAQTTEGLPNAVATTMERLCPELATVLLGAQRGHFTDDRNGAFWRERQIIYGFPNITAAVFISHGLQETAHPFQEDIAWEALRLAPKRMLLGQWDHEYPRVEDWQGVMMQWLDFWLKGLGTPADAGVGLVQYEDNTGGWHNSTTWPPAESEHNALVLQQKFMWGLPHAGNESRSFVPAPPLPRATTGAPREYLCEAPLSTAGGIEQPVRALVFKTPQMPGDVTLAAGNPYVVLEMRSDQPSGLFSVHLYRLRPGEACADSRLLTFGSVDLRFHAGNLQGTDFPTDATQTVRVDLNNMAEVLQPDDGLGLVLSYGDTISADEVANPLGDDRFSRSGQPASPTLTIDTGFTATNWSALGLPVVFGGVAYMGGPLFDETERPFTPA